MSEHEQIHPIYLDTEGGLITVNSSWSEAKLTYCLILSGPVDALHCLYPVATLSPDANNSASITLMEDGYTFSDLKDVRRWLRDLMMDWRDDGATPTTAPEPTLSAENDAIDDVVVVEDPSGEQSLEDTMSTSVFGSIADVRQDAHNRAIVEREADFSLTSIAQDQSQPQRIDEDAETVEETNRNEAETEQISSNAFNQLQPNHIDPSAETVQEAATRSFQDESQNYAREMDGPDLVPEADDSDKEDGEWDGAEVTMIPSSKPVAESAEWDGAERTMIGSASTDWDGAEKTMVGGASGDPLNWDGSEGTVIGNAPANWDGAEATVIGAPAGAQPRNQNDKDREASSTTASGSKTSTGTRTNPSFNDGWHLKGDPGPCTGQVWGDYEVGGKLGEGGMGTVYRGRQFSLRRRVAIKVLPPHLSNDPQMRERFELEAQSASVLNSPHVVQVFAAGTEKGNSYFVMEVVEGEDLHDVIKEHVGKKEQIDPHTAANYIIQAGRGLIEAQKHNFVHRDIKPPNLMLTKKGVVKIADFGIVKVMGESSLTMTGTAIGTPAYCSPEQGSGTGCDGRSDIYSLGVVFYELLTLAKPFDGNTGNALIYQHTYSEPKLLTEINPKCPASYQSVVLKCMQKNPDDRYQTAQELVDDLERVRLGTAPLAQVFGTGAEAMMKAQGLSRAKKWPMLVAAAAIILVLIGGFYWYKGASARDQRIDSLRNELVYLNEAEPPREGAEEYVFELAQLAGSSDADVVRWSQKIAALTSLTASLSRLDEGTDPSLEVLNATRPDYDDYVGYFGSAGEAARRWDRKLNEADAKIADVRSQINEDLRVADTELHVGIWDRVLPDLAILSHMAGEEDTDVKRAQGRYDKFQDRVDGLRQELTALDAEDLKVTEAQQKLFSNHLDELKSKVDDRDVDVLRWQIALAKQSGGLQNLRDKLSVLDSNQAEPYASQMMMSELQASLDAYKPLVVEEDIALQRWLKKYQDSKDIVAKHSQWFVDRVEPVDGWLTLNLQIKARERFNVIQKLLPDEDVKVEKWGDKLAESERITTSMRERLSGVLKQDRMSRADVGRARTTIDSLDLIGGLEESRDTYEAALREHENYHADLRDQLQAFNRVAPITKELQEALREFTRLIGSEDEEGKTWRAKNAEYERLFSSLTVLDQKIVISDETKENYKLLTNLIGHNDENVVRWRDKLDKVNNLEKQLNSLERAEALPKDAQSLLDEMAFLTGSRDDRFLRWTTKVARVAVLKNELTVLTNAYVLPLSSDEQMTELVSLVGKEDVDVLAWLPIIERLLGPSRPDWANDFGRDQFGIFADVLVADNTYRFRYVPAGSFLIGSPEDQTGRDYDEGQVPVTLTKGFWMAEQECIQSLWAALMFENPYPSKFQSGDRPVERVSWHDCQIFMQRLNEKLQLTSKQARLPTEAEWEYACRVGNESASYIDVDGKDTEADMVAWFYANSNDKTQSVKGRVSNALGLYDMHGNVWEWCNDNYGAYAPAGAVDPTGGAQDEFVIRGGSFYDYASTCRAANRLGVNGKIRTMFVGFRIAISLDRQSTDGLEFKPELNEDLLDPIADVPTKKNPQPDDKEPEADPTVIGKEEDIELSVTHE